LKTKIKTNGLICGSREHHYGYDADTQANNRVSAFRL
jgi:hypothetical protein